MCVEYMGAALTYLSESPVTTIKTDVQDWSKNKSVSACAASMQGWRRCMEDAYFMKHDALLDVFVFGVFDGHGGSGVSQYAAGRFTDLLFANEHYRSGNFDVALHEVFLDLDLETQEPVVQEELLRLHLSSKLATSASDTKLVEIHLSFETLLEIFLGDPTDPIRHPPNPFKVFGDDYVVPSVDEMIHVVEEVEPEAKRRLGRSVSRRHAQQTTEPHSPWGAIAGRIRRKEDPESILKDFKTLVDLVNLGNSQIGLLHLRDEIDWSNIDQILENPLGVFFQGSMLGAFNKTDKWVYSIHPISLMAELNNNHLVDVSPGVARRCVSDDQGCTANVCLLAMKSPNGPTLYCANAGDSRAILVRSGQAIPLSIDHKPGMPGERRRVLYAGGKVVGKLDPRVQGDLNLSRALGDWRHKQNANLPLELQMISPRPDISITECTTNHNKDPLYIVLGCDGIWERFSSTDCATLVDELLTGEKVNELNSPKNGPKSPNNGPQSPQGDSKLTKIKLNSPKNGSVSPKNGPNAPKSDSKSTKMEPNSPQSGAKSEAKKAKIENLGWVCQQVCEATVRGKDEFPGVPIGVTIGCDNMSVLLVRIAGSALPEKGAEPESATLPVISYGAQVPEDWKPVLSQKSSKGGNSRPTTPTRKKRKSAEAVENSPQVTSGCLPQ